MLNRIELFVSVIISLSLGSQLFGEEIRPKILQFKLGRFYFDVGREGNVFPGCRYLIICGSDTVSIGKIKESFAGISLTDTIGTDFSMSDSCTAVIHAAALDSEAAIHLLACEMDSSLVVSDIPINVRIIESTILSNPVVSLIAGSADGFFAYRDFGDELPVGDVIWAYYPRCVALIPNTSRAVNRNGLLTTSLYYRFSESRIPLLFDGDGVQPVNCLARTAQSCPRRFPYDPLQGRKLLEQISPKPKVIRIHFTEQSLSKVAYYFTDILSRDRMQVEIVNNEKDADILVAYVPFRPESPADALEYMYHTMTEMGVDTRGQKNKLKEIGVNVDALRDATTLSDSVQHCTAIDRMLTEEFGVFPLFQHRLYFHASDLLQNYRFDENGLFDCTELVKLKIPADTGSAP